MSDTPHLPHRAPIQLDGGRIGVLVIHGFMGSPQSIAPWAEGFHHAGFTVSAPTLTGHGRSWEELNQAQWSDWYRDVEQSFLALKEKCDHIFVAGFSMGGALALRLSQIRGSEIAGTLLVNAAIYDERWSMKLVPLLSKVIPSLGSGPTDVSKPNPPKHIFERIPLRALHSLQKLWRTVEEDLYLVDVPLLVGYSLEDHTVHPTNSETIMDNVYSANIREVIFTNSFHNVPLDHDAPLLIEESVIFIHDVLSGNLEEEISPEEEERQLVDAEFASIVSGLSLDQSHPSTYLDELEAIDESEYEKFIAPNPRLGHSDRLGRISSLATIGGIAYILAEQLLHLDFLGLGSWPGILSFLGGIATLIWKSARNDDDVDESDDGAVI